MEEGEDGRKRLGARIARQLRHRIRNLNRKRRQLSRHLRRRQHNFLFPLPLLPLLLLLGLQRILGRIGQRDAVRPRSHVQNRLRLDDLIDQRGAK